MLVERLPELVDLQVRLPRYGLRFKPWEEWKGNTRNPERWDSYNKVKHERNKWFGWLAGSRTLIVGHVATCCALAYYLNGKILEELIQADFEWRPGWEYAIARDFTDRPRQREKTVLTLRNWPTRGL